MNIDEALEKIYSLKQFHIKLGLENITQLLSHIGNPQNHLKSIHVAGSNGKGSTCSFLASILQEYGFTVGLYTSPHFINFNERIRINGVEISDDEIIKFLDSNKNYIDAEKPTFFEITTALAFNYFYEKKVDFSIVETGLGGRLDATNKLLPLASVISSISYEHCHILGETIEDITREKAGIIKKGIPVYIGNLPDVSIVTIEQIAKRHKSKLIKVNDFASILNRKLVMELNGALFKFYSFGLRGKYQLYNAAMAIKVSHDILKLNDHKKFSQGLDNVVSNTGIQGRYEKYGSNKNIIFEAAHNIEGIEMFVEEFKTEHLHRDNCKLIFGAMRDKDVGEMLLLLNPYFSKIYVTSTNYDRAATAEEIKLIASKHSIDVTINNSPDKLIFKYAGVKFEEYLVIIGSIYLIGKIKENLNN